MSWKMIPETNMGLLRSWASTLGPLAINLQSSLEKESQNNSQTTALWFCTNNHHSSWDGVIALRSCQILPWFSSGFQQENLVQAQDYLLSHLKKAFTLIGPKAHTSILEPFLPRSYLVQRLSYDFMVMPASLNFKPIIWPQESRIIPLTPCMALEVFTLQEAYEKEEVLLHPDDFHPQASFLHFQKSLHRGVHLGLPMHGQWICKGGTNAWTKKWAQIGGIYTQPAWRRQGWQKLLMSELIYRLALKGRGTCLFVKKDNHAARQLYLNLGFQMGGDFEISYWRP